MGRTAEICGRPTRRSLALGVLGVGALDLGALGLLAGCSSQADLVAGEQGRIARITDGDVLGLDTGLKVRLVEVEAPAPGYDGREDQPFAAEARNALSAAGMGREARLWYGGLSRDDYGRALAHVIARDETGADIWLNGYLASQGAARVRTWPDNARRARQLLALEAEARRSRRGLWSLDHWRIRSLEDPSDAPNFAVVEGGLASMDTTPAISAAHLSPAGIRLEASAQLGPPDPALDLSPGKPIRIRGRIDARTGAPLIRITHWAQVEMAS